MEFFFPQKVLFTVNKLFANEFSRFSLASFLFKEFQELLNEIKATLSWLLHSIGFSVPFDYSDFFLLCNVSIR